MIKNFYPGPSQLYPQVKDFMSEAYESGILSANHRSPAFVEMSQKAISLLKDKLDIPSNYTVFFTSSATECWEIIGQSFLSLYSFHIYNGAFGEKWFQYRKKLMPNASGLAFNMQRMMSMNALKNIPNPEVLCLTQNETSNATQVKNKLIRKVKKTFPQSLICIDATSSMAGIELEWQYADIWYASVQKCFGLPSGMAIMICSPRAIEKARELNLNQHYNSLVFMAEKMEAWQTTYTPNILNIYLLMRTVEMVNPIREVSRKIKKRAREMNNFLVENNYPILISNSSVRSDTVLAVKDKPEKIVAIKEKAKSVGIVLGNGYGNLKANTFRIANFPALSDEDFEELKGFLKLHRS